jgi:hypothetical protein
MTNIIDLKERVAEKERFVWMCDCGNCSFIIYSDGSLDCAECDAPQNEDAHYYTVKR